MQLSNGSVIALMVLPALTMARLRPHVKRDSQFMERAQDSTLDGNLDECGGTPPVETRNHHKLKNHHHHHKGSNPTTGSQPVNPVTKPVTQPITNPITQPINQTPPPTKSKPTVTYKGNPSKGGLLEANTKHPAFLIGSAVRAAQLDGSMDECSLPNLNLLVPEYEAKSDKIEPQSHEWVASPVDTIVSYTKKHNMAFKLHTLLFDQTMAPYFQSLNGNPDGLKAAIKEHINGVLARYGDSSIMVDVVNEVMAYDGSGAMKKDIFYNTLKDQYLPFAFNTAKAANSHPLLSLNENDAEGHFMKGLLHKYDGLLRVVKDLKAKGVKIDQVSLEGHFETGKVPKDLATVIKSFIDLELKVFISELDIKNTNGQDAQQADDFAFVFDACLKNYPGCMGINMWGLNDRVNWNGEAAKATLFDGNCKFKGIEEGVKAVLNGTKTFP